MKTPITLVLDNIRSLYNVGSLFRVADGLHIEAIYCCGITGYPQLADDDRPSWVAERADKEIRKTGLSGVDAVTFKVLESPIMAVAELKQKGYQVIALELTESSQDYRKVAIHFPVAVVIGHETDGVADNLLAQVDATVHLPMKGVGKSLNVSTAAAAFLYHLNDRYEASLTT